VPPIGFNRHLAWTHTVSTSRRFVIYQLALVPGDPTSYLVDGRPEKMSSQTVTVGSRRQTFYFTRCGLLLDLPPQAGYSWTSDTAYALGDPQTDNFERVLTAPYKRNSAVLFQRTPRSYYGVEPITEEQAARCERYVLQFMVIHKY